MSAMVGDWKQFLSSTSDNELDAIRKHERTGRPLGGDNFLSLLEIEADYLRMTLPFLMSRSILLF